VYYKSDETIYDVHSEELASLLVGKSIESMDARQNTLRLTDGTVLRFEGAGDCCAWFEPSLNLTMADPQNVITSVTEDQQKSDYEDYLFTLSVYAVDLQVMSVEVTGSEGSGYYGSSFQIDVFKPRTIESFLTK